MRAIELAYFTITLNKCLNVESNISVNEGESDLTKTILVTS